MSGYPSKAKIEYLREQYPRGTRVVCDSMEDFQGVPDGMTGTVDCVDDIGTVHVSWDNGSGLGLVYGEDRFHKI